MSITYLSPSLNFYKQACSNNNGSVLANPSSVGVWEVGILFPCSVACMACFSNTRFTLPFALRVASVPIPVSLRLGNGVVGLKYWRIPVLILKKKISFWKTMELILPPSLLQGQKCPLLLLLLGQPANVHCSTSTCPLTTPTKSHPHNLFFVMPSALAKFAKVKFTQNITALRYMPGWLSRWLPRLSRRMAALMNVYYRKPAALVFILSQKALMQLVSQARPTGVGQACVQWVRLARLWSNLHRQCCQGMTLRKFAFPERAT